MSSPPLYTYVSSDNVLNTLNGERVRKTLHKEFPPPFVNLTLFHRISQILPLRLSLTPIITT